MKRSKILILALVVITVMTALAACSANVEDGKIDVDSTIQYQLPFTVEVTGLEGVSGTVQVQPVDESAKAAALAAVRNVYYVANDAETYAVDISIVKDGKEIKVEKPVTVSIELKTAALPLDRYTVFHVHDGKASELVSAVDGQKITFTVSDFSVFVVVPKHTHAYGDWEIVTPASCGENGVRTRACKDCGDVQREEIPATGKHTLGENCVCTVCGKTAHAVNDDCVCAQCGKTVHGVKEGAYCKHGDYVYFGSYPQTAVTDSAITSALDTLAGALPTEENAQKWTDYGYYFEGAQKSYMWYIDLEKDGTEYRGVYFTSYRPSYTEGGVENIRDYKQYQNGYETGNVYWFAYEPIQWRILTTDTGIATLLCEMAIDAQNVYISAVNQDYRTIDGKKVWDNNYEYSTIRDWLNVTFCDTAFNDLEKSVIQLTLVDNSARSGNPANKENEWDTERRACSDTRDYVYLPSEREVTTADYGFDPNFNVKDTARQKRSTDYANAQGCYFECGWWLRSPRWSDTYTMLIVNVEGKAGYSDTSVDSTTRGVAPVVRIKL